MIIDQFLLVCAVIGWHDALVHRGVHFVETRVRDGLRYFPYRQILLDIADDLCALSIGDAGRGMRVRQTRGRLARVLVPRLRVRSRGR